MNAPHSRHRFRPALKGLRAAFRSERNLKVHGTVTLLVCAAGVVFAVTAVEWCLLILAIGGVFTAELLNTALEKALDRLAPEHHSLTGLAKDIAAAAVLVAAATAVIVGLIIFLPHGINLLYSLAGE